MCRTLSYDCDLCNQNYLVVQDYSHGWTVPTYTNIDDPVKHDKEIDCGFCNYTGYSVESHSWDANMICTKCGYEQ